MKREYFDKAAGLVERIDNLKETIFGLEKLKNSTNFKIIGENMLHTVELKENTLSTEIFIENNLDYFINTLNLELDELLTEFDTLTE